MLNSLFSTVRSFFLANTLLICISINGLPDFAIAQEASDDSEMGDTLSGFDEDESAEDVNDILSGFDEENNFHYSEENQSKTFNDDWNTFFGYTGISLSYSFVKLPPEDDSNSDWSGLTRIRPFFSITWDMKFGGNWKSRISSKSFYDFAFGLKERDTFTREVLNELEKEAEIREFYLEGTIFGSLDIRLGSQILAWGVADNFRVVDVLNPTDNREYGMTDIEDVRIPLPITRIDYYLGSYKLQTVAVHQIKFNKSAPLGSDYNSTTTEIEEIIPESNTENTEFGLALYGTFRGWDASFHWAQYFDDEPNLFITEVNLLPGVGIVPSLEYRHSRLTMSGIALSFNSGNYLWKTEAAKFWGMEFNNVKEKKFQLTEILLGTDYSGWSDTSLSIEHVIKHLNDFDYRLEAEPDYQKEDIIATTINFMQDYYNQTLHLQILGTMIGKWGDDGGLNRASLEYEMMDAFSVKGGVMIYQPGDSLYFQSLNDNDRIFFEARFSF
ncbi:MAG: ligand-binding protein SH3 [Deltaproteobacteria bacterium]|nr:ligand-binding protein SH3 [Deltaproteobacteria bacterium]